MSAVTVAARDTMSTTSGETRDHHSSISTVSTRPAARRIARPVLLETVASRPLCARVSLSLAGLGIVCHLRVIARLRREQHLPVAHPAPRAAFLFGRLGD